jgi:hypothetical protein
MNRPPISTLEKEGHFQAAKWLVVQALVDEVELGQLMEEDFLIYPLSGLFTLDAFPMEKGLYLKAYGSWIAALKEGVVPVPAKELSAVAWARSPDDLWLQEVPGGRYMPKPRRPFVRVQVHHMTYSPIDDVFRPMNLSADSIFWGLQFSFPQVYQCSKTKELLEVEDGELFQSIRKWIRNVTVPTPMLVKGKQVNLPIRLGKRCFPWINRHPQLKGLSVCNLKTSTTP